MKLYKLMKKPPFFLSASHWMTKNDHPVKSGPNSRQAVIIPLLLIQYGSISAKMKTMTKLKKYFVSSIKEMVVSASSLKKNPHTGKRTIDEYTLIEMENYAHELGISKIGYTKVNPNFIFNDFEILYDNAIMLTMEMNKERIATNPSLESSKEIFRTYENLGIAVNKIADFLRERGFDCHPSPAIGGDINTVPTAQDANLGYVGKNGILITPEFGPCVRLAAVFIDVDNLPMADINEHKWIKSFCETCNRCVKACPAGAIYETPKELPDGSHVYIDLHKCAQPFSEGC
ncbi:MAG TPA: 4Fe-4S binding protein, partial [Fusibacter sp.]|nr:4Fe-4S binding protein [Fusibacter sp.]